MPGNAIAVVGGETYATCLNQYAQSVHNGRRCRIRDILQIL